MNIGKKNGLSSLLNINQNECLELFMICKDGNH